ncbi:MAG: Na+/H+ antiporter subunit E [Planctomycetota bacterium]
MRTAIWASMLFAFYLALSGQWQNVFLVSSGAAASVVVALLMNRLEPRGVKDAPFSMLRCLVVYAPWLGYQVLIANLKVMRAVWSPSRVQPTVIRVPNPLASGLGRAIYANSITLTPGTVSLLLDGDEIVVHALTPDDAEGVLSGDMQARVQALEPPGGAA